MSFVPCSYCERRHCGTLRHVYWFAPLRGDDVLRVRQRLCPDCYAANLVALLTPLDCETLTCSACGISIEDDVHAIYVTHYPNRDVAERGAMALCEVHFDELRERISRNALELPDRYLDETDVVSFDAAPPVPLSPSGELKARASSPATRVSVHPLPPPPGGGARHGG